MKYLTLLLLAACVDAGPSPTRAPFRTPVAMNASKKKLTPRIALDDPDTAWARGNVPPCRWVVFRDSIGPYKMHRCPRKGDPEGMWGKP